MKHTCAAVSLVLGSVRERDGNKRAVTLEA